jgi:hypothetical protein
VEFKAGVLAASDDFDQNRYANATRTQFMNWSLWNNAAWDFAAETRGYTEGVVVGFISPRWSMKYGLYEMPVRANQQQLETSIRRARGENLELTYDRDGTIVRVLAYRNLARMGVYSDAIAVAQATGTVPDIVAQDRLIARSPSETNSRVAAGSGVRTAWHWPWRSTGCQSRTESISRTEASASCWATDASTTDRKRSSSVRICSTSAIPDTTGIAGPSRSTG